MLNPLAHQRIAKIRNKILSRLSPNQYKRLLAMGTHTYEEMLSNLNRITKGPHVRSQLWAMESELRMVRTMEKIRRTSNQSWHLGDQLVYSGRLKSNKDMYTLFRAFAVKQSQRR